jgi:hypothetical protein
MLFPTSFQHCNYPRIVFRAIALQRALKLHTTRSARRERWQRKRGDERAESFFLCTRSNIFSSRKLNLPRHIMFPSCCDCSSTLPNQQLQFDSTQQVALFLHFVSQWSFSLPLSFRRTSSCNEKAWELAPPLLAFFRFLLLLVFFFASRRAPSFHAKIVFL